MLTLFRFLAFLCLSVSVFGQGVITTVAGTQWILGGISRPGTQTPLGNVYSVASDWKGGVFIADTGNARIFHVDSQGTLSVYAGNGLDGFSGDGGPATNASLGWEVHIASDQAGNLYVNDCYNNRIRKIATDGTITTIAGNGQAGFSGDGGPALQASLNMWPASGIAVDASGNLYIADEQNYRVRKISGGRITTVAGNGTAGVSGDGGPATSASFTPLGVAVGPDGSLYIATGDDNRVRKVSPNGIISTFAGGGTAGDGGPATSASLNTPCDVAVDSAGVVYIADTFGGKIRKVGSNGIITTVAGSGSFVSSGDGAAATSAGLGFTPSLAIGPDGQMFIATNTIYTGNVTTARIRKVATTGIISTVAGNGSFKFAGDSGLATNASLYLPCGVVLDSDGSLYIADSFNFRVRKVSPAGVISTVAGNGDPFGPLGDGGPATSASMAPFSLALDQAHNLYIADRSYNRVRKVNTFGVISTVAGGGNSSADGIAATNAYLQRPSAIAFDSVGNLYIADGYAELIRRVTPSGIISTVAGNGKEGFSGDNGPATAASIDLNSFAFGLAVDQGGTLYFTDSANNRVRKVTPGGVITTVAGNGQTGYSGDGGPATLAAVEEPYAVALDSLGNLYISASWTVRKVSPNGTISLFAGGGSSLGDGGKPAQAEVAYPYGLTTDAFGNVYIADSDNDRIRKVTNATVTYQALPARLSFTATAGGTAPASQTLALSSAVNGLAFSAAATAPWLSLNSTSGPMPAILQVSVNPASLAAGTYQAGIAIAVPNAVPPTTTVSVALTVQPGTPAQLAVDTHSVSFTATQGSSALTQQLHVSNSGGGSLSFTATTTTSSGGSWLGISPANGAATPSSPASLTITAATGSLAPGTYSGTVTVAGAGSSINIPVTLSVSAPTAIILISQAGLSFTAVAQGGVPLPQNFGILNTGQGSMSWTATAATISGGNWLQISPSNGTVQRPYLDVSLVTVSVNPSALGAGTYYGRIQVSALAANTPQVMTVILTVLPAGLSLGPQLFPTGLIFTGLAGATPGSQDVQVGNPTGQVNNFLSGIIGTNFSFLPTNASVQPNQPTTVRVYPDFSTLSPGSIQRGTITLQFSDGSPSQTINVLIVVAPSGVTPNSVGAEFQEQAEPPAASGCSALAWSVQFRSLQPNFAAVLGQATAVDVQVADGCGNLVGPGGQSAYVAASVTGGDPVMAMTHIGNGIWQGTWKPVSAAGAVTLYVTAVGPNGIGGQNKVSGAVSAPAPAATTPTVTAQGVVHAASDQGGVPIAPGGLITVYGVDLSDGVGQNTGLPLPQQLNGTQVLLGNQPLPILYTSTGQLNVQVPFTAPVNTQYQLTVQHGNALSLPQQLVVAAGLPGIFAINQQGTGQGAIMKSDGVTLAQPVTPASIGETVVIYCTGLGAVTPAVKEGMPAPSTPPLSTTVNPVTVTIGGKAAQVAFSGLTPGYAGLYQVNAVVPAGIATGDAVPVMLSVAGQTSPAVTIAVR